MNHRFACVCLFAMGCTSGPIDDLGGDSVHDPAATGVNDKFGEESPGPAPAEVNLTQTSVPEGATNVDTEARVNFAATTNREGAVAVTAWLSTHSGFRGDDGTVVPIAVTVERVPKGQSYTHVFQVAAATALTADRWYTLAVSNGTGVRVHGLEPESDTGDGFRSRFFTGSSPRVRKIIRSDRALPTVVFSEPVQLGSLAKGLLVSDENGVSIACAAMAEACVTADDTRAADQVQLKFSADVPAHGALRVALAPTTLGSGRTVGEARALPAARTVSAIVVDAEAWRTGTRWAGLHEVRPIATAGALVR